MSENAAAANAWDKDVRRDAVASEFFAPSYWSASPIEQAAIRHIVSLEYQLWNLGVDVAVGQSARIATINEGGE